LEGTLPDNLYQLSQLQLLDLNTNHLHGTISNALGKLSHLHRVIFRRNQFIGSIPSSIGNLTQLVLCLIISYQEVFNLR